jgi:uncharacterized protein (TIGR02284 family)
MVTTVGLELDFLNMLGDLTSLEYDALGAYDAAISRVRDPEVKQQLQSFRADHDRHIRELDGIIRQLGGAPSPGPGVKSMLTQGKVAFGAIFGDKAILTAMKSNEDDTNTAYERAVHHSDARAPAMGMLRRALEDEQRHRDWIELAIGRL